MSVWNLYWVASDGLEDCFVVARNSRSACRIEIDMNGFDHGDVNATKVVRVPKGIEKMFVRRQTRAPKEHHPWPWYANRWLLGKLGAQFREIDGLEETLIDDTVYSGAGARPVGKKAIIDLRSDALVSNYKRSREDTWDASQSQLLTMLGMCIARCQQVEHYIAHSFILGISKQQKSRYETINDLIKGWKRKTLGSLLVAIDEAYDIEPTLRAGFQLFLDMRNQLVHGITTSDRYNIDTQWGQKELVAFLALFDVVSRVVRDAFRSSYYASIQLGIEKLSKSENLPKKLLTRSQVKEIGFFVHCFSPKAEDA